jgi:hypothetical protein
MKFFALMAGLVLFSTAWAAEPQPEPNVPVMPRVTLKDVFSALGDTQIPAAWAGVWTFTNDLYECTLQFPIGSNTETDTLCTGDLVNDDPKFSCGGTISDTSIEITCSGVQEYGPGCNALLSYTLVATRDGDSMTSTSTFTTDFDPDLCFKETPDFCIETQSTATRIAPEPKDCFTSVDEFSWGQVKAFYR